MGGASSIRTIPGRIEVVDGRAPLVSFSPNGEFATFKLDGGLVILRMSDGELINVLEDLVDPDKKPPTITQVAFASGKQGVVLSLLMSDGTYSAMLPATAPQKVLQGHAEFWPGGDGPAIVNGDTGDRLFGLPALSAVGFVDVLFDRSTHATLGIVRFGIDPEGGGAMPDPWALVVYADGTTRSLRMQVDAADFSQDSMTSAIVVRYADERSEIWDSMQRLTIGDLGLGVDSNTFNSAANRLAVRYLSGAAYLLDLDRLRTLPPDLSTLPDEGLIGRACAALGASAASLAPTACS